MLNTSISPNAEITAEQIQLGLAEFDTNSRYYFNMSDSFLMKVSFDVQVVILSEGVFLSYLFSNMLILLLAIVLILLIFSDQGGYRQERDNYLNAFFLTDKTFEDADMTSIARISSAISNVRHMSKEEFFGEIKDRYLELVSLPSLDGCEEFLKKENT